MRSHTSSLSMGPTTVLKYIMYTCKEPKVATVCTWWYHIAPNIWGPKFFADRLLLANFCRNELCGPRISVTYAHFCRPHAQFVFTVATMSCSAICFQIKAFCSGANISFVTWSLPIMLHVLETPPHWQTLGCQRNLQSGPQKSGSIHFKTTLENHVALDVHAIVQKWNSYCFNSRPYHAI